MSTPSQYYELYRNGSCGVALTDTLDEFITENRIDPQLAIKILTHFDKNIADVLGEKVKSRMSFKGHLDTYRFCDEVWTFIIKDITFKLDNSQNIHSDRVKIVAMNSKRPGCRNNRDIMDPHELQEERRFFRRELESIEKPRLKKKVTPKNKAAIKHEQTFEAPHTGENSETSSLDFSQSSFKTKMEHPMTESESHPQIKEEMPGRYGWF